MIGVGISAGLSGSKRARSIQDPLPALDLDWATDRSLPAAYGPTPSFSRASTGTFFNSSGTLTTAAVNGPRFNHVYDGTNWVSKGLLVEEQRTNSCRYSDLSAGFLTLRASINSSSTVAPDGSSSRKLVETATSGTHFNYASPPFLAITNGTVYTISAFVKAGERTKVLLSSNTGGLTLDTSFDLSSGAVISSSATSSAIVNVGNGWYRISATKACSVNDSTAPGINLLDGSGNSSYTGDGSSGLFIWGIQQESGSFPTSYIPTTSAAVTRSADVCQITGTDFSGFWNEPAGSIVAEGDTPASGTKSLVSADNATANESSVLRTVGTDPLFVVTDGSVAQASIDSGSVSSGTGFKVAAAYTVNDFAVSKDAAAVVADASGTIPTPTQINIGTDASGNYLCGHIARLRYYPTRLTNAKLQELST